MKPSRDEREATIAAATTAYRARDASGGILTDPAWLDLDEEGRRVAFDRAEALRRLEAALDLRGLSSTGRAVLARIRRG
jgi:hypothetical protein